MDKLRPENAPPCDKDELLNELRASVDAIDRLLERSPRDFYEQDRAEIERTRDFFYSRINELEREYR